MLNIQKKTETLMVDPPRDGKFAMAVVCGSILIQYSVDPFELNLYAFLFFTCNYNRLNVIFQLSFSNLLIHLHIWKIPACCRKKKKQPKKP